MAAANDLCPFRQRLGVEDRREVCERAKKAHPTYIPAILERGSLDVPAADKIKYLLPPDLTGAQLQYVVRRRMRMAKEQAFFLFCGEKCLVGAHETARQLYARHRDPEDGLLYITYTTENVFG